tara:strand:+ start:47 stop:565 length:519 start_codon:yes stop_codon:yes gene_type:complete
MKNKIYPLILTSFFVFVFIIFYKGLKNSNLYTPSVEIKNDIPQFSAESLFEKKIFDSENIFDKKKFYLLNIWASWCVPCRDEHPYLKKLKKNKKIEIIGLNYKDDFKNAIKFIDELGNPYSIILLDKDGTKSIEWGAFGVPETFLIYDNQIIKKFIGPLNIKSIKEIERVLK